MFVASLVTGLGRSQAQMLAPMLSMLPSKGLMQHLGAACKQASAGSTHMFTTNGPDEAVTSDLIEVREYTASPSGLSDYLKLTAEYADVRKELLPFLGMFTCDVGGVMHRLIHFYHYKDFDQRDMVRAAAGRDQRWQKYIQDSRKYLASQTCKVLREEGRVYDMLDMVPTSQYRSPPRDTDSKIMHVTYELRTYQLPRGYESMSQLVDALDCSLPDKVPDYNPSDKGQLVLYGHAEVGPLNQLTELWRWNTAQAAIRAREVKCAMPTMFHHTVAHTTGISHFNYEFLHPTAFSNWQ